MNNLQPTVLEVQCRCGKMINIRTKQPVKTVSCWVSRHVLEAHLGGGKTMLVSLLATLTAQGAKRQTSLLLHREISKSIGVVRQACPLI